MLPILLILSAVFVLLFVLRMGGAYRLVLVERWPALAFAGAALVLLARGAVWPGLGFGVLAIGAWVLWPAFNRRLRKYDSVAAEDPQDVQARAILGVTVTASESDIRRAYRAKMASAHPDRGGSNAEAARLTAARDRLLRKKR